MSYDLYMLTPEAGVDPMDQVERMEEGGGAAAKDPAGEARAARLADALCAADPRYERHEFEFEGSSGVELSAQDGLQITFWADHASVNIPYWDSLDPARLLADIERASAIVAAETGWKLYDPQLERFMDPAQEAEAFAEAFGFGTDAVRRIVSEPAREPSAWGRLRARFGRRA